MSNKASIFISAGDPSADFPGRQLIDQIKKTCPDVELFGLGGPFMQQAGMRPLADHRELAVMGFWEVAPRLFFFRRLMALAAEEIKARRPRLIILMDYPGFNLRLARRIKSLDIPVVYYISPQLWAWGRGRIRLVRDLMDLMLVIFPFEVDFYRAHGVTAKFVGHPVVDRFKNLPDRQTCRQSLQIGPNERLLALLPGSRPQEVRRMLPVMAEAAAPIMAQTENPRFIVAGVDNIESRVYGRIIRDRCIALVTGRTPELLNASDLVITSSGTATVEAACLTRPMVVIYKTGFLTYRIARCVVDLDAVAMVNIVAGKKIAPELIQGAASPEAIAREALRLLNDPQHYRQTVEQLQAVRQKLGGGDCGRRAFEAISELVPLC